MSRGRTQGLHYLKSKQGELPASCPLGSDGFHGSQAGDWTGCSVTKDAQTESRKTTLGS